MATSRQIFPTQRELVLVFAACVVPVFSWSIFQFLERMTGWLYYRDIFALLTIFAYTQAFAFVESVVLLAGLLLLYLLLLRHLFKERFVAAATAIVLLSSAWAIAFQYSDQLLRTMPLWQLLIVGLLYLGSIVGTLLMLQRLARVEKALVSISERLMVFLYLYVPIGLVSLFTVIFRNL